jgi:hypothetical protein
MPKIDQRLVDLLKQYGEDNASVWDCHGTWVAYHSAVERMAARAGILFDKPDMIVNDPGAKTVVVCVGATKGELREWSFGECSPANNKNAYPYAMAEKRAKDRVALKLLGMSGLVYSEEEADDFKASRPAPSEATSAVEKPKADDTTKPITAAEQKRQLAAINDDLLDAHSEVDVKRLVDIWATIAERDGWSSEYWNEARRRFAAKRASFDKPVTDAEALQHPMNA